MSHLIGPDFISIQAEDLDAAREFYSGIMGLAVQPGPPHAVVFDSKPIAFAVRTPLSDLTDGQLGQGVALWFACENADTLHDKLVDNDVPIVSAPKDGPFGRFLSFRDPFGYTITAHTA